MKKRAQAFDMFSHWPEWIALLLFVLGMYFALKAGSTPAILGLALIIGLFFGREFYRLKKQNAAMLTATLMLAGLVMGFFLVSWARGIRGELVFLLVAAGIALGYTIHTRGLIRT